MLIQITKNNLGVRNLYFGHPYSSETYTNSVTIKTPVEEWEADFEDIYSGNPVLMTPKTPIATPVEKEFRVVRGTKTMFIGNYQKAQEIEEDKDLYYSLVNLATVKINNPDYIPFEKYTAKIKKDRLKNIFEVKDIDPEQAKKYVDYAIEYDKDKKYSDVLIKKPYFTSMDEGIFILTEDFVDYNIELDVSPDDGVVGVKITMGENTSKYTKHYKEI